MKTAAVNHMIGMLGSLRTFGIGSSTGTMALRIEKAFGIKMDTLMRMQASYDIARARMRAGDIRVERYRTAAACSVTPQH